MSSLLEVSADEGARLVALDHLGDARAAARRLEDRSDGEALHDLRVALRRLRSCLRAYDALLGESVGAKLARRMRKLAELTGPGRDAEVQLAWLARLSAGASPAHDAGLRWLAAELERRRDKAYDRVREDAVRRFAKLEPKLRARLSSYEHVVRVGEPSGGEPFREAAARAIAAQLDALTHQLGGLESIDDEAAAHQARLAGKRLRYLLEPFRDELAEARPIVAELKRLQDRLGDLNDLGTLALTAGQALEDAALDRARQLREAASGGDDVEHALEGDERPGLFALLTRIRADRLALFEELTASWTGGALDALGQDVEAIAARLATAPPKDLEIERKYLLSALPPLCIGREAVEIDQGYLPGERLIERLRRKRTPKGVTYVRTVKLGQGIVRIEVEEPCTEEVFAQLWPLTEGRRLTKRRYAIEDGERIWEIDEFTDRELFLAEVELPTEEAEVVIPEWLAPSLEREVTGEDAYVNANLAR